jgi:hypothetical protein
VPVCLSSLAENQKVGARQSFHVIMA